VNTTNLFDGIPDELPEELFTTLLAADGLRIERIVSQGHASPPGLNIPAHARHRVAWTDPKEKTIWLAIHFSNPQISQINTD
jgi:cupin 2 domain-containing protein